MYQVEGFYLHEKFLLTYQVQRRETIVDKVKGFQGVYERLTHGVKNLVLQDIVNYVQKHTYELGVPNPRECF